MGEQTLIVILGIVFAILGLAIITRLKKLTSHKYYRILIFIIAILLVCFGVYLGIRGINQYG
ncbi:hypothetical protein DDV96_08815 [Marixanthomonas spongiae]|uniref:Uncharacterized protein n=1 Tax=Marixanthomonas spongiae TaxID=2174845 RepID=A0A2U0I0J6_9FLAO|nr:hypothetical protein DDV96_08815 [Marixanthomonas spongiae]